jgi:citrate lyase beta subunit
MIKVTIAAPDERKTHLADPSESIKGILDVNKVNHMKATLMLDGVILGASDVNKTLSQMNVPDNTDCTLSVTIKMDNAA